MSEKVKQRAKPVLSCKDSCTGCAACVNACNKNAISMVLGKDGFYYPEINHELCNRCLKCVKACPVIHSDLRFTNDQPKSFAMMASDEVRKVSSSGGFVPVLSAYVIEHGGIVYGAAWNNQNWSVYHTKITKLEELEKIRGSKYLQSDIGLIFRDVKFNLKNNKLILFVGTPCQIAGLYAFLGDKLSKSEYLLTVDLVCHGVPSYSVFYKYLTDNYNVNDIVKIDFRNKKVFGWIANINIKFKNGQEINELPENDYFFKAFNPCLIQRKSCSSCPFSCLPRQGDFSAGVDFQRQRCDR